MIEERFVLSRVYRWPDLVCSRSVGPLAHLTRLAISPRAESNTSKHFIRCLVSIRSLTFSLVDSVLKAVKRTFASIHITMKELMLLAFYLPFWFQDTAIPRP